MILYAIGILYLIWGTYEFHRIGLKTIIGPRASFGEIILVLLVVIGLWFVWPAVIWYLDDTP